MTKATKENKLPFDCEVGTESETVANPLSGESVQLTPHAVAVYDSVKGAEMFGNYNKMRKGLDWFIKYHDCNADSLESISKLEGMLENM